MSYKVGQILKKAQYIEFANWTAGHKEARLSAKALGNYRYEITAIPEPPAPTKEYQKERRAEAYRNEVDPITSHISRLRDAEQTEEIIAEIVELIAERDAKVAEIQERYPYPVEPKGKKGK